MDVQICAHCHKPVYDEENWIAENWIAMDGRTVHKHCYWLHKNPYSSNSNDYESSKKLYDNIAVDCAACHLPALKGSAFKTGDCSHLSGQVHPWCYSMHSAICEEHYHCNCNACTTKQNKWKELLHHEQEKQKHWK